MNYVPLGEIVTIKGGGTPDKSNPNYWGGDIPWASVKDFKTNEIYQTSDHITALGVANSATNIVPAGSIIIPTRMAVGKAAINRVDLAINQDLKALFVSSRVETRYLLHALLASSELLEEQATGATVKGITLDVLRGLNILLPPLAEQQRIAAILDQADVLRGKQREALACLDDVSRSIFSQTFGDPVTNDRGWPRVKLGDVLSGIDGGWSPICLDRPALEHEWGVLKLGAVTYGRYNETAQKALPPDLEPRPQVEVKVGDLLFTRKNTYDLVAACALVRETRPRLMLPDLIFRLRIADPTAVHPEFIHAMLSHPGQRKEVQQLASGAAGSMPNISKGRLVELRISLPPIALQLSFSDKIRSIERLRKAVISSAAKHDKLFSSLQHRAFRGEL